MESNPSFAPRFRDRGAKGLVDVGSTSEGADSTVGEIRDISVANGWMAALLWDLVTLPVNEGRADPITARKGFGAITGRDVGDSLIDSSKLSSSSLAFMILARLLKFEEGNRGQSFINHKQSLPCDTTNKLSPSSSSNEGGEVAAGKLLKSGSVRVDDTVIYNVLSSG